MNVFKIKKEVKNFKRFEEILGILAGEEYHHIIQKIAMGHPSLLKRKKEGLNQEQLKEPERIRKLLEKLGPTFVKLGQLLSLRPDLVPHEYCDEFKKLQDDVNPVSYKEIEEVIKAELGKPSNKLFKYFDKKHLSAASMGQVHKATLHNGKKVIVKVERPHIREIVESDIDILEVVANILNKKEEYKELDVKEIVKEFKNYTEKELDLKFELRNIQKFRKYFADWDDIKIPEPYSDLCTSKVLVMELIDGIPLSNKKKLVEKKYDLTSINTTMFKSIMYQAFDFGIFHGDAHPGNLLMEDKKLVFIDFGIVGFMSEEMQKETIKLLSSLADNDSSRAVKYFLKIVETDYESKVDAFTHEAEVLIRDWHGTSVKEMKFTSLVYELIKTATKNKIKVSPELVLLAKSMLTMEGTAADLDPNFNVSKSVQPILHEIVMKKFAPKTVAKKLKKESIDMAEILEQIPDITQKIIHALESGGIKVQIQDSELREIERNFDRESNIRSVAILAGLLFVGSALFANSDAQPLIWGRPLSDIGFFVSMLLIFALIAIFLKENKQS